MSSSTTLFERLEQLREFKGSGPAYWGRYAEVLAHASESRVVIVLGGAADDLGAWREWARFGVLESGQAPFPPEVVQKIHQETQRTGMAETVLGADGGQSLIGLRLRTGEAGQEALAVMLTAADGAEAAVRRREKLQLLADRPESDRAAQGAQRVRGKLDRAAQALDLLALLTALRAFKPATLVMVNQLATRLECTQVAMGWLKGRHLRLVAVSQLAKFAKKVEAVRDLEAIMDEALAQDDEVVWPEDPESLVVAREHSQYAARNGVPYLTSIPLRVGNRVVATINLQRQDKSFDDQDLALLRMVSDQAAPWLAQLHRAESFRERWRERLNRWWGVEHAWTKLGVGAAVALMLFLMLGKMMYRVDAPFILRSTQQVLLPAPFEGYIARVEKDIGDIVQAGEALLSLDDAILRQREAGLLADIERAQGEADRAESASRFAERRIALAEAKQAEAELAAARYQISQAVLRAPWDGMIVEGRHRERIGSAVESGELLFRIARIDSVYVEIDVDERDIQEVSHGAAGEIAFASQPEVSFPLEVSRVEPAGSARDRRSVFVVRADLPGGLENWWRPGMTGVAKIEAGRRSFWWIGTHRLVDFIRLKLWWW